MKYKTPSHIAHDHFSGATELTSGSLRTAAAYLKKSDTQDRAILIRDYHTLWKDIIDAQPFMASLRTTYQRICRAIEQLDFKNYETEAIREQLLKIITREDRKVRRNLTCLGEKASGIINPNMKIVTYSRSSSVEKLFLTARNLNIPFSVILSEARPNKEGIRFAKALARKKVPVTLVIDVHLYHYLAVAQCLILGADWISETQFTNKIGSALLVDLALKQNILVYVVATTDKIFAQKFYPLTVDEQPPGEILSAKLDHIRIKNRYFEAIPFSEEIRVITEQGILRHSGITLFLNANSSQK